MTKLTATAPTRIDLAGGTLDLWPLHHLLPSKATVNIGVTLEARVDLVTSGDDLFHVRSQDQGVEIKGSLNEICQSRQLPLIGHMLQAVWSEALPPLTIVTAAKSPAGAGLGGSSCLAVTLCKALWSMRRKVSGGEDLGERDLVRLAQNVEAKLIRAPTGSQDYWGAIRGAVNVMTFPFGGEEIETFAPNHLPGLTDQLILAYSGKSRSSAINNWEIFKKVIEGETEMTAIFEQIGEVANVCASLVTEGHLDRALQASSQEWELRKKLWPGVETAETKRLSEAAAANGAYFSRVCGAGGGGVMSVFTPPEKREQVSEAIRRAGGLILPATVALEGLKVVHD